MILEKTESLVLVPVPGTPGPGATEWPPPPFTGPPPLEVDESDNDEDVQKDVWTRPGADIRDFCPHCWARLEGRTTHYCPVGNDVEHVVDHTNVCYACYEVHEELVGVAAAARASISSSASSSGRVQRSELVGVRAMQRRSEFTGSEAADSSISALRDPELGDISDVGELDLSRLEKRAEQSKVIEDFARGHLALLNTHTGCLHLARPYEQSRVYTGDAVQTPDGAFTPKCGSGISDGEFHRGEPHPDRVQWHCDECLELLNTEQEEREQ
jgi:hypothetical protein